MGNDFYTDEGIRKWKKRIKELEREEKEWTKKKKKGSDQDPVEQGLEGVETTSAPTSELQVRVLPHEQRRVERKKVTLKRTPHNRKKEQANKDGGLEQHSAVPKVPQIRGRNIRPRKPNKGVPVAKGEQTDLPTISNRSHKGDNK